MAIPSPHDYETDIVAWSREQAQWLKAGRFDRLDLEHLADEIGTTYPQDPAEPRANP